MKFRTASFLLDFMFYILMQWMDTISTSEREEVTFVWTFLRDEQVVHAQMT
jgi:hypothetical protein